MCAFLLVSCGEEIHKGKDTSGSVDTPAGPRDISRTDGVELMVEIEPAWVMGDVYEVGDLNADGFGDIVGFGGVFVGEHETYAIKPQVYVFYGPIEAIEDGDQPMSAADSLVYEPGVVYEGYSPFAAEPSDVDGDGIEDLVLGLDKTSERSVVVLVMNGSEGGILPFEPSAIIERAGDYNLLDIAGLGDITGDGNEDIAWTDGYTSSVTLIPGPIRADHEYTEYVTTVCESCDVALAGHGDVDGNGVPDLLVSSEYSVWLLDGPVIGPINLDAAEAVFDFMGNSWTVSMGDTNGDGYSDLVLGPRVYNGPAVLPHYGLDDYSFRAIYEDEIGESTEDDYDLQSSATGDMNGDGNEEVIVTYDIYTGTVHRRGMFLFTGPLEGTVTTLDAAARFDHEGWRGTPGGDVNADGFADLAILNFLYYGGADW